MQANAPALRAGHSLQDGIRRPTALPVQVLRERFIVLPAPNTGNCAEKTTGRIDG